MNERFHIDDIVICKPITKDVPCKGRGAIIETYQQTNHPRIYIVEWSNGKIGPYTGDQLTKVSNNKPTSISAIIRETSFAKSWSQPRDQHGNFTSDSEEGKPITSDGGVSKYYAVNVNGTEIHVEELIKQIFDNDFDYGNIFKSLVRAFSITSGTGGKKGNTLQYEQNKIRHSLNRLGK